MSDFIATVLPDPAAPAPALAPIVNDGWFPDIDPAMWRDQMRIRDSVTPARMQDALVAAILTVGRDLAGWAAERKAEGATSLASVPAPTIGGISIKVLSYRRAVFTAAKAEVVERYRDIDMTGAGQRKADDLDPSVTELRRDSLHAIRDIRDVTRTTVDLI